MMVSVIDYFVANPTYAVSVFTNQNRYELMLSKKIASSINSVTQVLMSPKQTNQVRLFRVCAMESSELITMKNRSHDANLQITTANWQLEGYVPDHLVKTYWQANTICGARAGVFPKIWQVMKEKYGPIIPS